MGDGGGEGVRIVAKIFQLTTILRKLLSRTKICKHFMKNSIGTFIAQTEGFKSFIPNKFLPKGAFSALADSHKKDKEGNAQMGKARWDH